MTGWKGIAAGVLAEAGVETTASRLVRVPFRDRDRRIVVHKVFGGSRSWYDPAGVDLIPFGIETLPVSPWIAERSALLVCEGESDALSARQYFPEGDDEVLFWFAIALPGAGVWRRSWRCHLESFPRIYLLGDGDEPGRRMNRRIAMRAGRARSGCRTARTCGRSSSATAATAPSGTWRPPTPTRTSLRHSG